MTSSLDKLNLRPAEKRLVVVAAVAFFIVLNLIFIVPRFGEWGRLEREKGEIQGRLNKFAVEVNKQGFYKKELDRLRRIGQAVPAEEQGGDMFKTIMTQGALSGVNIQNQSPVGSGRSVTGGKTNIFFEEKTSIVTLNATEQQLVDFLYLLGNGDSLIRAKSMDLRPDPTRIRLSAGLTLVASYQKKQDKKASAASGAPLTSTNAPAAPIVSPFKAPPTYPKTNAIPRRIGTNALARPTGPVKPQ